jgi:tetratricopeptide (TPR) repeat protein
VAGAGTGAADWEAGRAAYESGDYDTARKEFARYVANDPRDPSYAVAYFMLGSCHAELGQADEATAMMRTAIELDPGRVDYRLALARHLIRIERHDEVDAVLVGEGLGAISPRQQATIAQLRAQAALEAGEPRRAVAVLEQALADLGAVASLHRALGLAAESAGDRERACGHLIRAFELDESDAPVGRRAASIALDLASKAADSTVSGTWNRRALAVSERLVGTDASPKHHTLLGEAAFAAGDYATAVPALAAASEANPLDTRMAYLLGRSLAELGDEEQALEVLSAAVHRRPEDRLAGRIHRQVGRIHAHRLDLDDAVRSFELAGDDQTAGMIRRVDAEIGEALEARRGLLAKIQTLHDMELELASLNDEDGARAMRERRAEFQQELAALDSNLDEVRRALRDL